MVGSLGFITELQRRLPVEIIKSNRTGGIVLVTQVFLVTALTFSFSTLIILSSPFKILNLTKPMAIIGIFGGLTQLLFAIVSSHSRAGLNLIQFSREILLRNLIIIVAGAGLTFVLPHAKYVFVAEALIILLYTAWLVRRFFPDIRTLGAKKLLSTSLKGLQAYNWYPVFSLFFIGLAAFINQNIERYIGKHFLSIDGFATLSFGLIIPYVANMVQSILNSSIFTNQILEFQNHKNTQKTIVYSVKVSMIIGCVFLVVSTPAYYIAKEVILTYYSKYSSIVPHLHWLFLAFVVRGSDFISNIYTIINRPHITVLIHVFYLAALVWAFLGLWYFGLADFQNPEIYLILNFVNGVGPPIIMLLVGLQYSRKNLQLAGSD